MQARHISARLFLEGVEVDLVSSSFTCGIGQQASATLVIPYADEVHNLLPRTLVHVFWSETSYDGTEEGLIGARRSVDYGDLKDWRLMFAGEVLSYSFAKVAGQRQISLMCADFTSYWDQAQLYWGSGRTSYASFKQAVFAGATHMQRNGKKVTNTKTLQQILSAKPATFTVLPGLLGGVVSLLESVTGVYSRSSKRRFRGVNDFMSQAELRLHLTRTIAASPEDDTSVAFLESRAFRRYLYRLARQTKSTSSYQQMVQTLLGTCYNQVSSQLAPSFHAEGLKVTTKILVPSGVKYKSSSEATKVYQELVATQKIVGSTKSRELERNAHFFKNKGDAQKKIEGSDYMRYDPEYRRTAADGTTDGFPTITNANTAKQRQREFSEDLKKPVEAGGGGGFLNRDPTELGKLSKKLTDDARNTPGSSIGKRANIRKANVYSRGVAKAVLALDALHLITNEGKYKAGAYAAGRTPESFDPYIQHTAKNFLIAKGHLDEAVKLMGKSLKAPYRTKTTKVTFDSRLHCTLMAPDIFMVPPPKCNLLVPNSYTSIRFARNWMSEITRLWMHTRTNGGRPRKDMYFSPNTSILFGPSAANAEAAIRKGASFMMNHEVYTGIIPKIEAIGDKGTLKKVHKRAIAKARKQGLSAQKAREAVSGHAAYSENEYLSRAANYLFLSSRFASRTMQVRCRFSPHIVTGAPLLVLDPADGNDDSSSGVHYVGMVASLQHVLDASGGAETVVTLTKCRRHNEGLRLFGANKDGLGAALKRYRVRVKRKLKPPDFGRGYEGDDNRDRVGLNKSLRVAGSTDNSSIEYQHPPRTSYARSVGLVSNNDEKHAFAMKVEAKSQYNKTSNAVDVKKIGPSVPRKAIRQIINFNREAGKEYDIKLRRDFKSPRYGDGKFSATHPEGGYLVFPATEPTPDGKGREAVTLTYVEVYEVFKSYKKKDINFTFEATATPPWFASIYRAVNIGTDFYTPMFGCLSILDTSSVSVDDTTDTTEVRIQRVTDSGTVEQAVDIPTEVLEPADNTQVAATRLAKTWRALRESGADLDLWFENHTARKYATLLDIMGNTNKFLSFNYREGVYFDPGNVAITGFHGNAYGLLTNMEDTQGVRLDYKPLYKDGKKGTLRHINGSADPRAGRYKAVIRYLDDLAATGQRTNTPTGIRPNRRSRDDDETTE